MHMSLYFINYRDTYHTKLDISYYVAMNNRVRKQVSVASLYMRTRKSVQRNFPVHHEFALKELSLNKTVKIRNALFETVFRVTPLPTQHSMRAWDFIK